MNSTKTILCIIILFVSFSNCRKTEKKPNLGLLLLLANRNTATTPLTGSQTTADLFSNNASVSSEDSSESGSMGDSSNTTNSILERAITFTSTGANSGTLNLTNEIVNCPLGGTITFNGKQDILVNPRTDFYNKTSTITNGTRNITYSSCIVSSSVTINSGTYITTQLTPDIGVTTMNTSCPSCVSGSTITRTLTNLKTTTSGTINITVTGRRGTGTGDITLTNNILTLTSRVRTWKLVDGKFTSPALVSRAGTLTGTTTINGTSYTINRTLDVNID